MKSKIILINALLTFVLVTTASAQNLQKDSVSSAISAYRFVKEINNHSIDEVLNDPLKVPTVLEVPFSEDFIERYDFAVFDKTTNLFEPHIFKKETLINNIPISVQTNPTIVAKNLMIDGDARTYVNFNLPEDTQGNAQITINSTSPITSSSLTTLLANNVALPTYVEIRADVDGQNNIVVARRKMTQHTIAFPQTTSNKWQIKFTYGQPLRISELRMHQDNATKSSVRAIRFLAQPEHIYSIYFDPDRLVKVPVGEVGNLALAQDVVITKETPSQKNSNYIMADIDEDGVPDSTDNCVSVGNAEQLDINDNGRGDACDDFDQDGIINYSDNCPDSPNRDQLDTDEDGVGDVCDNEESRITERYPLVPWIGIGFACAVLISLFVITAKAKPDIG